MATQVEFKLVKGGLHYKTAIKVEQGDERLHATELRLIQEVPRYSYTGVTAASDFNIISLKPKDLDELIASLQVARLFLATTEYDGKE